MFLANESAQFGGVDCGDVVVPGDRDAGYFGEFADAARVFSAAVTTPIAAFGVDPQGGGLPEFEQAGGLIDLFVEG